MAESEFKYELISSKDAKANGLRHYFTGRPCKRGHVSLRLVSTLQCCECLRERLPIYREANREKYREYDRRQKDKDRPKLRQRDKERYWRNPKKAVDKVKAHYRRNAEKLRAKRRSHWEKLRTDVIAYAEILRLGRERVKQWVIDNPDKAAALRRVGAGKRRNRIKNIEGDFTRVDIDNLFKGQKGKCVYCNCKLGIKYHVDHIVAVSRGGTNDKSNLQLLCRPCNLQKGARDPIVHARSLGLLL